MLSFYPTKRTINATRAFFRLTRRKMKLWRLNNFEPTRTNVGGNLYIRRYSKGQIFVERFADILKD